MKNKILGPLSITALFMLLNGVVVSAQYCPSKSNAPWELWIAKVQLNTLNNASDKFKDYNTLGYSDFTNLTTTLKKGTYYELTTTAGVSWSGIVPNAYCRAWIDWNQNNVFEDAEQVSYNAAVNSYSSELRVPTTAVVGTTRMRIAVKLGAYPTACDVFASGEVEDYTVKIEEPNASNSFDLTVTNLNAPSRWADNQTDSIRFDIKNAGGAAFSGNATIYVSVVSENPASVESFIINYLNVVNLGPNSSKSFASAIRLPTTWTTESASYAITVSANENELNTTNNRATIPVFIPLRPLACGNQISSGNTILCYDNSNPNAVKINVAEGNSVVQKTVDKNGQVLSSSTVGDFVKDSFLVVNNQVIKKLANGTIAFTKTITPSVLSRFSTIELALEMSDGSFVLAGLQKYFAPQGNQPYNRDSLVLVTTDAQLNFQESTVVFQVGGPYVPPYNGVLQLIGLPSTNQFVVAYYIGRSESVSQSILYFSKYQKNNNRLQYINGYVNGSYIYGKAVLTSACGNNLIFENRVAIGESSKGGTSGGYYSTILSVDSMRPLTLKSIVQGNSLLGPSSTFNYIHNPSLEDRTYTITANYGYNSAIGRTNYAELNISFYDNAGLLSFRKTIPFIPYEHVVRTGDTTCLLLLKRNGLIVAYNPDCNNPPNTLPDLTVTNLTVSTPSVQKRGILYFKFDGKNIAEGNATNAFTIKSYLSRDRILDAQDFQDGVILTANYASGTTISQIQGAMTVAASVDTGNYFLILKIDADNQIAESNEYNNTIFTQVRVTQNSPQDTNDIGLGLLTNPEYRPYSTQNIRLLIQNLGNRVFTNVKIDFPFPNKTVGGGTVVPSIGTWQEWCSGGVHCFTWTIPLLEARKTATLDVPLYILDAVNSIPLAMHVLSGTPMINVYAVITSIRPALLPLPQPLIQSKPTQLIPVVIQRINPTLTENYIIVEMESIVDKQIDFHILNTLGTIVLSEKIRIEKGNNKTQIDVSQLPKGVYFIQTSVGQGRNVPMKFVKF